MRIGGLLVTLASTVLLAGCTGRACPDAGFGDEVTLRIAPDLAARTDTIDVRVCQDGGCGRTRVPELKGYVTGDDQPLRLGVGLPGLGDGDWHAGDATALVQPRDAGGRVIRDYRIAFTLIEDQPNGDGCDPTVVQAVLRIG